MPATSLAVVSTVFVANPIKVARKPRLSRFSGTAERTAPVAKNEAANAPTSGPRSSLRAPQRGSTLPAGKNAASPSREMEMKLRRRLWFSALACSHLAMLASLSAADELPVKRVVLFTSGVGFFQREGEVSGDASVEMSFRTEQINDLLKSLVLEDFGGGKIAPVVFGSRDPIERTLKSFAIDLTDNPPLAELLNRMRGIEIEITAPNGIKGVVVGTEVQEQKVKDEVIRIKVLNLMTEQGLRA